MNKKVRVILKSITSGLVALVVIFALLLVGVRLFGLKVYTVLSPSMEPEYKTGALIYVRPIDPENLQVGDVITFSLSGGTTATHRITEIVNDEDTGLSFKTKGDANKIEDASPVAAQNVIGTPVFDISYLGFVVNFIQNPPGMYLAIAIGLILVIFVFMLDTLSADEKDEKADGAKIENKDEKERQQ